jgi:predicted dehydrogenase
MACQYRLTRDFVDAIREDRAPISSGRDGRDALELVMAVWESARVGKPVSLPLEQRDHPLEVWRRTSQ